MNEKVRKLVTMAMLAALSIVLVYVIHFPIFPAASFLEYDPADIPILIGTFAYGPLAGVLLTVVVSVIQGMTVSSGSGLMGIAMHIFATSILVLVAGNIYRVKHTKKGAVLALRRDAVVGPRIRLQMILAAAPRVRAPSGPKLPSE